MRIEGRRSEDGGRRTEVGGRTSDVRRQTSDIGGRRKDERRTSNGGERRAQSRREKRLNIFLFKILASLRLFARNISYRFRLDGMEDAGNFVNLFRPLIHIPKEGTTPKRKKGFLLDSGVLVLGRCHLIRFGLLSDYE